MEQPLSTKLIIPPLRSKLIIRADLVERINTHLDRNLILVSAPAGFGKTTLISEWANTSNKPVVWLSLDQGDNDVNIFLKYIIFALQIYFSNMGKQALEIISSPQKIDTKLILSNLINEINKSSEHIFLVLDDYQVIEDSQVEEAIAFLIENIPPQFHLIISTREDPQLPLARIRARNQMIEIRTKDLRFTNEETERFLNNIMELSLTKTEINTLDSRTEGWVAGLQLAGISMQTGVDKVEFIRSFTGSHQYVMDFLIEEVLNQQPEKVQNFLLHTSILNRLSGSLCDAVLENQSTTGQEMLAYLDQANLFVIPLDQERQWYRYHHLFADLLRQRLQNKYSKNLEDKNFSIHQLHNRASKWYEAHGFLLEAFQHAISANDMDSAERLLAGDGMPLQYRGIAKPILNWLTSLPKEILYERPSLLVTYASTLTMLGKPLENIEQILQKAESALEQDLSNQTTRDYIGQIAAIRAMLAIPKNQIDEIILQSQRALEYLHPDNLPIRTNALWSLGFAHQLKGDRTSAKKDLQQVFASSESSSNIMMMIASLTNLAQLHLADLQLIEAKNLFEQVIKIAGEPPLPFACEALLGLANIAYEWNDLQQAENLIQQSLELAFILENVDTPIMAYLLYARIEIAHQDYDNAIQYVQNAEQFATKNKFFHRNQDIIKIKALLFIKQNAFDEALLLAKEHHLSSIEAEIYLAKKDGARAAEILSPLHNQMKINLWIAEFFEVLLLEVQAYHLLQQRNKLESTLEDLLQIASTNQLIRSLIDQGPIVERIIKSMPKKLETATYRSQILIAFEEEFENHPVKQMEVGNQNMNLLSPRETEVLHLIAQGYSNSEIGEKLFLALNTIKGLNRKLFQKLNAKNRTEAVVNARNLGIL